MLYLFWLLAIAASLVLCLSLGFSGAAFAGCLVLFAILAFLAVFILYILILWIFAPVVARKEPEMKDYPFFRLIVLETVRLALFFGGVRIHTEGMEQIPEGKFLLAGNHRSGFDPFVTLWALRKYPLSFVSKKENFKISFAAPYMRLTGFLSIDRDDDRQALRVIKMAAEYMEKGVVSFGIYPEGSRSRTAEMLPFRNGCFKAAQRAKVPVVVASIHNSENIVKQGPFFPTPVTLRICGVIDAETVCSMKATQLGDEVRRMLEESLTK